MIFKPDGKEGIFSLIQNKILNIDEIDLNKNFDFWLDNNDKKFHIYNRVYDCNIGNDSRYSEMIRRFNMRLRKPINPSGRII
nr:hypothetical protein GTC16762_19220 [Pigmentibacter ruber]